MKKLAILSSLALLVAPSFKGNAFTDLARNQIKMIDEAGDTETATVSPYATLTFGTVVQEAGHSNKRSTADIEEYWVNDNEENVTVTAKTVTDCYTNKKKKNVSAGSEEALRIGASNGGTLKLNVAFKDDMIIDKITVSVRAFTSKTAGGTIGVSYDSFSGTESSIKYNDGDFYEVEFVNDDSENASKEIDLTLTNTTTKSIVISKISLYASAVSEDSATITYDYGDYKNDSWKQSDIVTKGEKATPSISADYQFTDWAGTHTLLGWEKDDGTEFDFSTATIDEDITVHAVWVDDETDELKNIKDKSKTKSQLHYEYSADKLETTTLTFGDNDSSGTFNKNSFTNDGNLTITNVTSDTCYAGTVGKDALRVGSGSYSGTFTLTFAESVVKEVNIYARAYGSDKTSLDCTLTSTANATGVTNTIKRNTSNSFVEYTYSNLDNGTNETSTSITFGKYEKKSNQRISIQKIEIITSDATADGGTYYVSNMGLRFGGQIAKEHYEAATQNEEGKTVKDHVASVGMIWTTTLPEKTDGNAYDNLTDAIKAGAVTAENAHIKSQDVASKELVLDGDYYRYNCNISVSEASIATVVYAVATMTFDNGLTIYLEETSYSVVTIAKAYVADEATYAAYSEPIQKTLKALSEGKTSVAIA